MNGFDSSKDTGLHMLLLHGCRAHELLIATISSQLSNWKTSVIFMYRWRLKMVCLYYSGVKLFASNILTYMRLKVPRFPDWPFTWAICGDESKRELLQHSRSPLKVLDPSAAGDLIWQTTIKKQFRDVYREHRKQFIPPEWHPNYLPPFIVLVARQAEGIHLVLPVLASLHLLRQSDHINNSCSTQWEWS